MPVMSIFVEKLEILLNDKELANIMGGAGRKRAEELFNWEKIAQDFLDITKNLLHKENLDELYSDENEYGGHYSKEGNKKIAELIFYELEKQKII